MKIRNHSLAMLSSIFIASAAFTGCAAPGRTTDINNAATPRMQQQGVTDQGNYLQRVATTPVPGDRLGNNTDTINPAPQATTQQMQDNRQKSERIENSLRTMNEIDQVNVVIMGNTALVGYSPSRTGQDVNTTKNLIISKVKESDNAITNVTVSESADMMGRIGTLTNDIANNRPADQITTEFNQIIRGIVPVTR